MQEEQDFGNTNQKDNLKIASWVFGISYALLFASGLSHQCIVNFKNKSTKGYSTDYSLVGLTGFSFLLINQTVGIIFPDSDAGRVRATDMAFSSSAFVFALTAFAQTRIYPSDASLRSTRLAISIVVGVFLAAALLQLAGVEFESYAFGLSLLQFAALVPATSSLIKYSYQIRSNIIRGSTAGLS